MLRVRKWWFEGRKVKDLMKKTAEKIPELINVVSILRNHKSNLAKLHFDNENQ
jgi:hypothetical protein